MPGKADKPSTTLTGWQGGVARLSAVLSKPWFEPAIITLIIVNAIMLGLETSPAVMAAIGPQLQVIDDIVVVIFVLEILARIIVHGRAFWRDPWSLFDFTIIAITLIPATGNLSILRSLRIMRALRLISAVPSIKRVVASLLTAVPGMMSVLLLLLILVYVYSVMATTLFGAEFPKLFGSIGGSAFTFFQIMTLEGWANEIVRPVMVKFPWAWAFFVPFIIFATFMVLNLFIGIVVDAMQQQHADPLIANPAAPPTEHQLVMNELALLRAELAALRDGSPAAAVDGPGALAQNAVKTAPAKSPAPAGAKTKRKRRRGK